MLLLLLAVRRKVLRVPHESAVPVQRALLRTELYSMETLSPLELEARVHELAQLVQVTM